MDAFYTFAAFYYFTQKSTYNANQGDFLHRNKPIKFHMTIFYSLSSP